MHNRYSNGHESGRAALEMILVLCIMGILSIAIVVGAHYAIIRAQVVETENLISKSVAGVRTSHYLENLSHQYEAENEDLFALAEKIETSFYISDIALSQPGDKEYDLYGGENFKGPAGTVISANVLVNGLGLIINLNQISTEICEAILEHKLGYEAAFRLNDLYSQGGYLSISDNSIFHAQDSVIGSTGAEVRTRLCAPDIKDAYGLENVAHIGLLFSASPDRNISFDCEGACSSCTQCILDMCLPIKKDICGELAYYDYQSCSCRCYANTSGDPHTKCECPSGTFFDTDKKKCVLCQTDQDCYQQNPYKPFCEEDGMACWGCSDYAKTDDSYKNSVFVLPSNSPGTQEPQNFDPSSTCLTCAAQGLHEKWVDNNLLCVECNTDDDCHHQETLRICDQETNTCVCPGMMTWNDKSGRCECIVDVSGDHFDNQNCVCATGYETVITTNAENQEDISCFSPCVGLGMTGVRENGVCLCDTSKGYLRLAISTDDNGQPITPYCPCDTDQGYFQDANGGCVKCHPISDEQKKAFEDGSIDPHTYVDTWNCGRSYLGFVRWFNPDYTQDARLTNGEKYCPDGWVLKREHDVTKELKIDDRTYQVIDVDKSSGLFKCTPCRDLTDPNGKPAIAEGTGWGYCGCGRYTIPIYYTAENALNNKRGSGGTCQSSCYDTYKAWYQNETSEDATARKGYHLDSFDARNSSFGTGSEAEGCGWNWNYNFISDQPGQRFEDIAIPQGKDEWKKVNIARTDCGINGERPLWDKNGRRNFSYERWYRNTPQKCHPGNHYYYQTMSGDCSYEKGCTTTYLSLAACGANVQIKDCTCEGSYVARGANKDICCHKNQYLKGSQCVYCPTGQIPNMDGTACIVCKAGEYVENGACLACPAGSEPNTDKTGCIACREGYAVQNGTCQKCPSGYIPNTNKTACEACKNGMIVISEYQNGLLTKTYCDCPKTQFEVKDNVTGETYCRTSEEDKCYNGVCCSSGKYPVCTDEHCTNTRCCPDGYTLFGSDTCIICPEGTKTIESTPNSGRYACGA